MWPCRCRHSVTLAVGGQLLLRLTSLLTLPGARESQERDRHCLRMRMQPGDKRRDKARCPPLFIVVMISGHLTNGRLWKIGIQYRQLVHFIFACVWSKQGSRGKKNYGRKLPLCQEPTQQRSTLLFFPLRLHLLLLIMFLLSYSCVTVCIFFTTTYCTNCFPLLFF